MFLVLFIVYQWAYTLLINRLCQLKLLSWESDLSIVVRVLGHINLQELSTLILKLPYSEITRAHSLTEDHPPKSWPFVSSWVPTKPHSLNKIDFQLYDLCEWSFLNPYPYLYRVDCFIDFKYLLEININQQKFNAGSIMHYLLFLDSQYSQTDKENLIPTRDRSTVLSVPRPPCLTDILILTTEHIRFMELRNCSLGYLT